MTQAVLDGRPAAPARRPVHLWVVGILAMLWNSVGAFDYVATQFRLEFYVSQFTPEQLAYFTGFPAWAVAMWAFGVWGAFVGSVGLLLARAWAVWAFAVSLVGLAANTVYSYLLSNGAEMMGTVGTVMTATIWVIAVALFVYAWRLRSRGVLR